MKLLKPKQARSDENQGLKRGSELFMPCSDGPVFFDFLEEAFDQVTLLINMLVVWPLLNPIRFWRDNRDLAIGGGEF